MIQTLFHPVVAQWFQERLGAPTEPQQLGWPQIASRRNVLIAAPTGSGKTLAAFMVCLDQLIQEWLAGQLDDSIHVVYLSPLKALSNDIQRNLQGPLAEITERLGSAGYPGLPLRVAVRTGDTPAAERQAMLRRPPHILVTTPESFYILLTASKSRELLKTTRTVIVDEIHALARDKRGSHLSLSLERLNALCERPPVRVGLSATQRPIDEIARFLVGGADPQVLPATDERHAAADCVIVDAGHVRKLDLAIECPAGELSAVCSHEQWSAVYERLQQQIHAHRSTLIFVNSRRMAERVTHHLTEMLGEDAVASHHGSLSRQSRWNAEQRLKSGELKAIVATASLELGIDVGYIDLVCQIGSPHSIATFLQRIGRSGHSLGALPKGRLFPLTRDELLECMALVRSVRQRILDRIEIPEMPLDILAQQIVASVACEELPERSLYERLRRAWPYRELSWEQFSEVVGLLSDGIARGNRRGAYLHRDRIHGMLRARRGAKLAAVTSGGAIPETAEYRVVTEQERTGVGSVDEHFAIDSSAGDVFLLGNTSWRIRAIRNGEVIVQDAQGAPPSIPFWFGEGPGRTFELSLEVSRLRQDLCEPPAGLAEECGTDAATFQQATLYVESQRAALGIVPTDQQMVFERFFDESGGMQLVIHSPLGARINRAWGLAFRKRFCRSFDFELQAAATDNGIVLSIGPQHSFPIESLFKMLGAHNGQVLLEQALLVAPMFQVRWRWNVTRSLAVLRHQNGKKVPPHMQRFRSDDLLAACFPETVGCLENHSGDVEIPDHPLVQQTMRDCLYEAMDTRRWLKVLEDIQQGRIELIARDTREPSPFCYEILNANPYAFLDGAPLEERRTRAIATRRSVTPEDVRDLARLDPDAIRQVREEAWPTVRDADELHDALCGLVCVPDRLCLEWEPFFAPLVADSRAVRVHVGDRCFWVATERWPMVRTLFPAARPESAVSLPADLDRPVDETVAILALVRGRIECSGPISARTLEADWGIGVSLIASALEALEGQGIVLRGRFSEALQAGRPVGPEDLEWCERRLLARIHRLTLDGLRQRIRPVAPEDYMRFLVHRHRLSGPSQWRGAAGVRESLQLLEGWEAPAAAWERLLLAPRIAEYDSRWLDQIFLAGEVTWGRLRLPRRDETSEAALAMTRSLPISLVLREHLPWLLEPDRELPLDQFHGGARQAWGILQQYGALFFQELHRAAQLLPSQLEDALRELAAWGAITSDSFAAVRAIVEGQKHSRRRRRSGSRGGLRGVAAPTGRWSKFPGFVEPVTSEERAARWCELLLRRYGVVFRDLLERESASPPWRELLPVLRRMELRGTVRGGRFVAGVSGEQFADERAVEQLRQIRDTAAQDDWIVLSAVDPLNLCGRILPGPRIAASHRNTLILRNGRCAGVRVGADVQILEVLEPERRAELERALITGRKLPQLHDRRGRGETAEPVE